MNGDSMYFKVRKIKYMKIKPAILSTFLLFTVFLFSFKTPGKTAARRISSSLADCTAAQIKTDTGGRIVNLDSAQVCIDRFAALMNAHGFSDQAGQPIDIHLTTTTMITTGESFNGTDLRNWLNATLKQYNKVNKKLMIKIQFGVYDLNYLNTYQPNIASNTANNNRIAIFLIPYDAASGVAAKNLTAVANESGGTQPGGSGTGYDLGGLQP
jgi:hypothetical protein